MLGSNLNKAWNVSALNINVKHGKCKFTMLRGKLLQFGKVEATKTSANKSFYF